MQQMITAVFDTARHAQIAVDDLLGSEIPSASIHQYRLVAGAEPEMAIQPENELHRPMSPWAWLINDHPPPSSSRSRQVALYRECRSRNEPVVVTVGPSHVPKSKVRKILTDHAPLEMRGVSEGGSYANTSLEKEIQMDPA